MKSSIILFIATVIGFLAMGIRNSFGVFLKPMTLDLGWSREVFAFGLAVQELLSQCVAQDVAPDQIVLALRMLLIDLRTSRVRASAMAARWKRFKPSEASRSRRRLWKTGNSSPASIRTSLGRDCLR